MLSYSKQCFLGLKHEADQKKKKKNKLIKTNKPLNKILVPYIVGQIVPFIRFLTMLETRLSEENITSNLQPFDHPFCQSFHLNPHTNLLC